MKKSIVRILLACLLACPALASYTYEVYAYGDSKTLNGTQSILVDQQGGMYRLTLTQDSSATIRGTSALAEGYGGIWHISMFGQSTLEFSGGQVNQLDLNNSATAVLTGGLIQQIWSYQVAWKWVGGGGDPPAPPVLVWNPHITIVYSGALPTLQTIYGLPHLVGLWGNGDPFSIYLSPVPASSYGYSPAIDNIKFTIIPEPMTVILLGLGGLLLRKRKDRQAH